MNIDDLLSGKVNKREAELLWDIVSSGTKLRVRSLPIELDFAKDSSDRELMIFGFQDQIELNVSSSAGFEITVSSKDERTTLTMVRTSSEDARDLFVNFSDDLIRLMDNCQGLTILQCAAMLESRIRAWQQFMKKSSKVISNAIEIGLFGELSFMKAWLSRGGRPTRLLDIWNGPLHGARDFTFSEGYAVEVKTSLSTNPLKVRIDSISQLDISDYPYLKLAVIKLEEVEAGDNLNSLREEILILLGKKELQLEFESGLISYGYNPENPGRKLRSFRTEYIRLFEAESLPRITLGSIPGVVEAKYDIVIISNSGDVLQGIVECNPEEVFQKLTDLGK